MLLIHLSPSFLTTSSRRRIISLLPSFSFSLLPSHDISTSSLLTLILLSPIFIFLLFFHSSLLSTASHFPHFLLLSLPTVLSPSLPPLAQPPIFAFSSPFLSFSLSNTQHSPRFPSLDFPLLFIYLPSYLFSIKLLSLCLLIPASCLSFLLSVRTRHSV